MSGQRDLPISETYACIIFFSYLTIGNYSRFVDRFRLNMKVIAESFSGMKDLLFIIVFSTIFVGFSFDFAKGMDFVTQESLFKSFTYQYKIMYGDFSHIDINEFGAIEWIFFFATTTFIPLVLLNLLIARISESYD
jgi:hypothetical protein